MQNPSVMNPGARRGKKKKAEIKRESGPQVQTRKLADNVYTGIVREGPFGSQFLEGNGTYSWTTGIKYEGPFLQSRIEGKGKLSWPDGSFYEGGLQNGKRHGFGSYVGPDGTTKYEGEWYMGKRHGRGKLTYSGDGTAFYDGMWAEGQKHGDGYQVWPSGNEYSGDWDNGTMKGQGRMIWKTPAGVEEYSGVWHDNEPHGEGTHVWHASAPHSNLGNGEGAPPVGMWRQGNNRYTGQFQRSKREGVGTFYYANGSYYHGGWQNHKKNGHGRHTSEDGSVFEGVFVNDQMVGPSTAPADPTPLYYAEDNPICRCTDLTDLDVFALPLDCSGLDQGAVTGYTDAVKIFREVYNMLLRNLGELRELYARYRVLLPFADEDPFMLSCAEMWTMARDFGILTPICPLARFNRVLFSGPRHQREVVPEDMHDFRPLTPRLERRLSLGQKLPQPVVPTRGGDGESVGGRPVSQGLSNTGGSEDIDESSIASSMHSPTNTSDARPTTGEGARSLSTASAVRAPDFGAMSRQGSMLGSEFMDGSSDIRGLGREVRLWTPLDGPAGGEDEFTGKTPFRRAEGDRCRNIHDPNRPLLQRQFLDGMVRLSMARFPHERGLESQVNRFFKELMTPGYDSPTRSDRYFASLVDPDLRKVFNEHRPLLERLFSTDESTAPTDRDGIEGIRGCGDFCPPRRAFTIRGRHDSSVRVKDLLRLLHRTGLLGPTPLSALPAADDPFGCAVPRPEVITDAPADYQGLTLDLDGCSAFGGAGDASATAGSAATTINGGDVRRTSLQDQAAAAEPVQVEMAALPAAAESTGNGDVRVSLVGALRIVTEVYDESQLNAIRMRLDPEDIKPSGEQLPLLEYLETELTYPEFELAFVRLAEQGATRRDAADPKALAKRLDHFLRNVFAPALASPYKPPAPPAEAVAAPLAAEAAEVAEEATAGAGGEAAEGEGDEVQAEVVPVAAEGVQVFLDLWHGFDGGGSRARDEARWVPRVWPGSYEEDVARW